MPTRSIAPNKIWSGVYPGKYKGNLWQTYNIDLEREENRLVLSDKFRVLTDSGDAAEPGTPFGFIRTDADGVDKFWCLSSSKMLKTAGSNPFVAYAADGLSNSPTDPRDMETHEDNNNNQRLVVTRATDIAILNRATANNVWTASWWVGTLGKAALIPSNFHPVRRLQRLLIIGDAHKVHTIDKNDVAVHDRLKLSLGYEARCIVVTPSFAGGAGRAWIGFQHKRDDHAKIVEWDGSSLAQNNEYNLQGNSVQCMFVINGIPYAIDNWGLIYFYTGQGFEPIQQFPVFEEKLLFDSGLAEENYIHPNGVTTDGHRAYILVGVRNTTRRVRSGVWVFNTVNKNLYHYMGLGAHKTAGIDLEYGGFLHRPGALKLVSQEPTLRGFLAGASIFTTASATKRIISRNIPNSEQTSNSGRNVGYFITPYIPVAEIEAFWEGLWLKYKAMAHATSQLIVKYRAAEPLKNSDNFDINAVLQAEGTWVDALRFTCAVPTGVSVGDEVEIMQGPNAGVSRHISSMSGTPNGSSVLTVTLDGAVPTVGTDTALFRFDNFRIMDTVETRLFTPTTAMAKNQFVQFKIVLAGISVEIDDLIPKWKEATNSEQQ